MEGIAPEQVSGAAVGPNTFVASNPTVDLQTPLLRKRN
jgi:hypothetical protein